MLKVEHLNKTFGSSCILKDVNAEVNKGDVISIIGPSGTGKSTFIRCLNRLEKPTSGKIWLDGELTTAPGYDLKNLRRRMGMVFQSFNLFEHMNVAENIMAGPVHILGLSREEAYKKTMEILEKVGMANRALKFPDELSGGQKQRAAIARAIAMEPEILLLDEPTSALDPTMVGEVLNVIRSLADNGHTLMIVTHELSFARSVSNRIFYMDEGIIYEEGTPEEIFDHPKREKTHSFVLGMKSAKIVTTPGSFDYTDFKLQVVKFTKRNQIPKAQSQKLNIFVEEFVISRLLSALTYDTGISVEMLYSEKDGKVRLNVKYNGAPVEGIEESLTDAADIECTHTPENETEYKCEING